MCDMLSVHGQMLCPSMVSCSLEAIILSFPGAVVILHIGIGPSINLQDHLQERMNSYVT